MRMAICVDTETQKYFTPAPQFNLKDKLLWEANKLRRYRYAEGLEGFKNLITVLGTYGIPATFFMMESLKNQIRITNPLFDIGSHGYSHKPLTLLPDEELAIEIGKCTGTSFGAPSNMIEDTNNQDRVINLLKRRGFKIIRWVGIENGLQQNHQDGVAELFKRHGILAVRGSKYFEGTSDEKYMTDLLNYIYAQKENPPKLPDKRIFVLSTHDFTHKDPTTIDYLIRVLKEDFEFVNLAQLAKETTNET
jgi:peptidoglycan/xylan/chitin deacetylase (PgdA/CDA1 family)